MISVTQSPLPQGALIQRYSDAGDFVDCFTCRVPAAVSLQRYIQAFYSSGVFWAERQGLKLMNFHPGNSAQVTSLAAGETDVFSAWTVEARTDSQLLLCDVNAQTRSWLMAALADDQTTQLYFGSVIVKQPGSAENPKMPLGFRLVMGFHEVYSKALLKAAARTLTMQA